MRSKFEGALIEDKTRESSNIVGSCTQEANKYNGQKNRLFRGYRYFQLKIQIKKVRNFLKTLDLTNKIALDGPNTNIRFMQLTPVNWDQSLMMMTMMSHLRVASCLSFNCWSIFVQYLSQRQGTTCACDGGGCTYDMY